MRVAERAFSHSAALRAPTFFTALVSPIARPRPWGVATVHGAFPPGFSSQAASQLQPSPSCAAPRASCAWHLPPR
eukprot:558164-Heterocapsa_arctica.AAC.1